MPLYLDDYIYILGHSNKALDSIEKYFTLKPSSVGPPKMYLDGKVSRAGMSNGVTLYSISTSQYTIPDTDMYSKINEIDANYYASLIGLFCWIWNMGRIGIICNCQ